MQSIQTIQRPCLPPGILKNKQNCDNSSPYLIPHHDQSENWNFLAGSSQQEADDCEHEDLEDESLDFCQKKSAVGASILSVSQPMQAKTWSEPSYFILQRE